MGILDIKVRLEDGSVVIIEMQIKNNYNIAERMTYYNAKSVATQLKKGAEYIDLKPVTSIVILDYPIYECERYVSTSRIVQEDEIIMVDKMKFKVIELPKVRKREPNYEDKLYCWLMFIDGKKEEVIEMIKTKYPIFEEAEEELRKIYSESEVEAIMESREKWEWDMSSLKRHITEESEKRGEKKGIKKGKKEGIKQGKMETAKAMLGYKFDIKVIANITQIPLEEVRKIKEGKFIEK